MEKEILRLASEIHQIGIDDIVSLPSGILLIGENLSPESKILNVTSDGYTTIGDYLDYLGKMPEVISSEVRPLEREAEEKIKFMEKEIKRLKEENENLKKERKKERKKKINKNRKREIKSYLAI